MPFHTKWSQHTFASPWLHVWSSMNKPASISCLIFRISSRASTCCQVKKVKAISRTWLKILYPIKRIPSFSSFIWHKAFILFDAGEGFSYDGITFVDDKKCSQMAKLTAFFPNTNLRNDTNSISKIQHTKIKTTSSFTRYGNDLHKKLTLAIMSV